MKSLKLIIIIFSLIIILAASINALDLTKIIEHYDFNNGSFTGSYAHTYATGNASIITNASCFGLGACVGFDVAGEVFTSNALLPLLTGTKGSVTMWVSIAKDASMVFMELGKAPITSSIYQRIINDDGGDELTFSSKNGGAFVWERKGLTLVTNTRYLLTLMSSGTAVTAYYNNSQMPAPTNTTLTSWWDDMTTSGWNTAIWGAYDIGSSGMIGYIDEITFWDDTLNATEISELVAGVNLSNNTFGNGTGAGETPSITLGDNTTSSHVYNLTSNSLYASAVVKDFNTSTSTNIRLYKDGALHRQANGTAGNLSYNFTGLDNGIYIINATSQNTTAQINSTSINVSIYGMYLNATYTDSSTSQNATINYSGNTTPYTNRISYFMIDLLNSDGTLNKSLGNNSESLSYNLNFYGEHIRDGIYKVKIRAYDNASNSKNSTGINITLSYPANYLIVGSATINFTSGFNASGSANISYSCINRIAGNASANVSFDTTTLVSAQTRINNTGYTNNSLGMREGVNNLAVYCYDFNTYDFENKTITAYIKTLYLIDEVDNTGFNVSNLSSVRVYYDDNSSYFDFKNKSVSTINYSTDEEAKLRFEFEREDGEIIIVYIDVNITDTPIRVCVNKDGTTQYEQYIISATQRAAMLKNVFSNCYVASDYTRFAYQDSYILKAYTIDSQYYLYTRDTSTGNSIYLASVDGSIQTYMYLDVLEFNRAKISPAIQGDALSFELLSNSTIKIYYRNLRSDNAQVNITIDRIDTNTNLLTTTEVSTPNEFIIYFDTTTLSNITNNTVFMITLNRTTTGGNFYQIKKYFNTGASTGVISAALAAAISILLVVFGLTFTRPSTALGWFGVLCMLGAIGILSLALSSWYILVLLAMEIIILVYIVILLVSQNYGAIT